MSVKCTRPGHHLGYSHAKFKKGLETGPCEKRAEVSFEHCGGKCNEGELRKKVVRKEKKGTVSLQRHTLDECQILLLVSILHSFEEQGNPLQKLELKYCGLEKPSVVLFCEKFDGKVRTLDLSGNKDMDESLFDLVQKLESVNVNLSDCKLTEEHVKRLKGLKVNKLVLNHKAFKHPSCAKHLYHSINNRLKELILVDCGITTAILSDLANELGDKISLNTLDISMNALDDDSAVAVTKIVNKTDGVYRLGLSQCSITPSWMEKFYLNISKGVKRLELGDNEEIHEPSSQNQWLVSAVDKCGVVVLDLSATRLMPDHTKYYSRQKRPAKLKELIINENPFMDASAVGAWIRRWEVDKVDLSECHWTENQIEDLNMSLGRYRMLGQINLSEPSKAARDSKLDALDRLSKRVKNPIKFGYISATTQQKERMQTMKLEIVFSGKTDSEADTPCHSKHTGNAH